MSASIVCRSLSNRLGLLGLLFILALSASCEQSEVATPRPVVVQIAGATGMHPVLEELGVAFTQRHSSVLVDIRGGGSALGETRVRDGRSTLGASTLPPDAAESRPQIGAVIPAPTATAAGPASSTATILATAPGGGPPTVSAVSLQPVPLNRVPIGVDAIAVIVNADNPVNAITATQLRDVFSGRILDWEELGGPPGEITLVSREDGSGTRHAFESRIMRDRDVNLTAVVMPTSADVVDYVSRNPQAIGYVSASHLTAPPGTQAEQEPADAPAVHVASLDGVLPSDATVRDQSYLLVQPLYLVTNGPPQGWTRQFIDFALSPAGQAIVDRYHTPVR